MSIKHYRRLMHSKSASNQVKALARRKFWHAVSLHNGINKKRKK